MAGGVTVAESARMRQQSRTLLPALPALKVAAACSLLGPTTAVSRYAEPTISCGERNQ